MSDYPGAAFSLTLRDSKVVALYYEDQYIALNTVEPRGRIENPDRMSYHEVMLTPQQVDHLIQALQEMKTEINRRYQKAITQ